MLAGAGFVLGEREFLLGEEIWGYLWYWEAELGDKDLCWGDLERGIEWGRMCTGRGFC